MNKWSLYSQIQRHIQAPRTAMIPSMPRLASRNHRPNQAAALEKEAAALEKESRQT